MKICELSGSVLELIYYAQIKTSKLPKPKRELQFHKPRRFRFDFAWEQERIAVEVEGGTYSKSRHTSGTGFHNDCEKYNIATLNGWKVFRFDAKMVKNGEALETTLKAFKIYNH